MSVNDYAVLFIFLLFIIYAGLMAYILFRERKINRNLEGKYLLTKLELLEERNVNIDGDKAYQVLKNKYDFLLKKYRYVRRKQYNSLFKKGGNNYEKEINNNS